MIERDFRAAEMKRQDTLAHAARMREAAGSSPGPEQPARFGVGSWSRARAANVLDRSAALLWQAARRLDRQPAFAGRRG